MKKLRIYIDTSVIGGYFDSEFETWSRGLVEDFRGGHFHPVVSDVTAAEVAAAPKPVRDLYAELVSLDAEVLAVGEEALDLLSAYRARAVLGQRFQNDMLHIALATIAEVDVLVSWNFRHVVRLDKIRLFNAVNIELGYKPLTIYSPREVTSHGGDEDDQNS